MTGHIIWQSMKIKYFAMLLERKQLTLQRLADKSETAEHKDFSKFIAECVVSGDLPGEDVIINADLAERVQQWQYGIYFSCFYGLEFITYNIIKAFGGDHGVAVAFNQDTIIQRCEEHKARLLPNENVICKHTEYIERISNTYLNSEFEAQYPQIVFLKSPRYQDENEFRIVLDIRARQINGVGEKARFDVFLSHPIEHLPILLSDIVQIAIPRGDNLETILETVMHSHGLRLDPIMDSDSLFDQPVVMYSVFQ